MKDKSLSEKIIGVRVNLCVADHKKLKILAAHNDTTLAKQAKIFVVEGIKNSKLV